MMIAHHIVDVLLGNVKTPRIVEPFVPSDRRRSMCAGLLQRAAKFDFRTLAVEKIPGDTTVPGGSWALPSLTANELEFWAEGLIPLPYDVVWYEFTLGGSRSGLLVYQSDEHPGKLFCERLDWTTEGLLYDGLVASIDYGDIKPGSTELPVTIQGNHKFLDAMANHERLRVILKQNVACAAPLALYFTLMLNSRTTETENAAKPDEKLNRRRVQRGREPLPAHRIVTIIPDRYIERGEGLGGTHRSPRLHWRRSHKRHYEESTPSSKWVPNENYRGRTGWFVAIIARQLVGRADLGEVSHEYRIERSEEPARAVA